MQNSKIVAVGLALLLAACGKDSNSPTGTDDTSIFGTYALQTILGESLPLIVLEEGDDKLEFIAGSIRLDRDDTYSRSVTTRLTQSGNVTTDVFTVAGTFTANGSALQFSGSGDDRGEGPFTGSISGNTLTIIDASRPFVYRKP